MNNTFSRFVPRLSAACLLISTASFALDSTWIGGSTGNWNVAGNWSAGIPLAATDTATLNKPVTINVPASITLKTLTVQAPATITVAAGATLAFSNSGADALIASADTTINGAGDLTFSRNGTSTTDFANLKPSAGVTITLNTRITDVAGSGIELNAPGTLLLTNPNNSFTGMTIVTAASGTLAFSAPGALGLSAIRFHGSPSKFIYIGSAPATLTIPVQVNAASATFENSGSGSLTLAGDIAPISAGTKTMAFLGTTQANIISGVVSNSLGLLNLSSDAGTLVLNGRVVDSTLIANSGSTFAIGSNANFQNRTLNINAGAVVALNPSVADNFVVTLPLTNNLNAAGARLVLPAAATASTVTLPNLIRSAGATLDVAATELGTARNKLLIQNFTPGPLPAWFTVNGQPAVYSATLGVTPMTATGPTHSLSALGPSTIVNDPTSAAVINSAGTAGGITLAADPTTLFSLTQDYAGNPATVNLGGGTLAASVVAITAAGNSLTLADGTLATPSALTPPSGPAILPTLPTAPIAWFDLADAATVTTNAEGRISLLANKGSRGATLDAIAPVDRIGPLYVPGAVNGLGIARSDGIVPPQGLATLNNAGIIGSAPRTAFLVLARSPVTQNTVYGLSLGPDGGGNQSFNLIERPEKTSFATTGNDLDIYPPSSVGHNVLTFITGQGGVPNVGEGFRNGISGGTKTFAFNTTDNLIYLLHRPNTVANFSGPGEMAEALVFDYTLSPSDRAAVESYLMKKWGIATVREESLLALRNDNPTSELAVSAIVADPYSTTLALAKSGPGNATLSGPLAFTGPLLLDGGTLTFNTPATQTTVLSAPISGSGAIVKQGSGDLALSLPSQYAGGTTVQGGTLYPGINGSLGTGPLSIMAGGALDIANGSVAANPITGTTAIANPIAVEGLGPDGLGALRHSGSVGQQNAFKSVALTGDAAVYSASRIDVRGGAFDFGGHALTVNGGGEFSIVNSEISNVTPATAVHVANGMMRFEGSDFKGSAASVVDAVSGSGIALYQMTVPMQWSLLLANNAYLRANNGDLNTNLNQWAGPVTLASGTARFNALASGTVAITGAINGNGGLLKEGPGWFWLFNNANTYAGTTVVTQGNLYAVSPGSLGTQGAAGLTVSDTGALVARIASATSVDGWTASEINAIAGASVFTTPATTTLGFDTIYEDFSYTEDLPYIGLRKSGPYKLRLTGDASDLGQLNVYEGELDFTDSGNHNLHTYPMLVGTSSDTAKLATLRLANTLLKSDDPGYNRLSAALAIGSAANARAILYVDANAAVNGRLVVGDAAGSAGAVYQSSGVVTNMGGTANDAVLGSYGYGYYRLDGGELANKGYTQLGRYSGSTGIFEQRGGAFILNPGAAPADGVVGSYYNGTLSTRKGVGVYLLSGGTFDLNGHSFQLGEYSSAGDYNDGNATLTLENDAQAFVDFVMLANRNGNPEASVNLNGGELTTKYFQKGGNNAAGNTGKAAINFNGGTLHVPSAGNVVSSLVRTGANNTPTVLNVNAGGAIIDTLDTASITLDQPLRAPVNLSVTSVTLTSAGAGYIAPPAVLIGGNAIGATATAVAEIDLNTGTLTGIRVTSPGSGYTTAPAVTLRGGGSTTPAVAKSTLGAVASGGLTKLGTGTLNLNAANTYTGPTVVSNGVLRLGAGSTTLSAFTPLTVAGGTLDLGGSTHTNFQPVVIESGRLINGAVSALSFTKTGLGLATLTARAVAPTPAAVREAFIRSLGPIIWFDPSDTTPGNVTVDGSGRVSRLRNKGTLGTTHDAIPYAGTGPLLRSGAASISPLGAGVLQIDNNTAAMKTTANVPVTGTAPRTLVALLARDGTLRSAVGIGSGADGQTFEIGNDPAKSYVSGIGAARDTQFTTGIPAVDKLTFIAAVNGYGGSFVRGIQLWRSIGADLETLTATWPADLGTAAAPLVIGRRATNDTFRGKVGEVLLFDRVLTASEIAALKDAIVAKYLIAPAGEQSLAVPPIIVAEGTLRLAPSAESIASLAPAVWYDPSDAAGVTTNAAGRVIGIVNKGTRSATMNAVVQSGFQGPLLVSGANSYSASKPMLKIDANATGLMSASNTGISGTAPHTTIAVLSRDPTSPDPNESNAVISFGRATTRQMVELADRSNAACYGTFSDDLSISPVLAAANANVYMMAATANNVVTGWRSGGTPSMVSKTLAGNWATAGDTPLQLGYRFGTTARLNFRGQIGEVLLFDRLLSEAERVDLEDYLVNKWTRKDGDTLFNDTVFNVATGATLDLNGARGNITVIGTGTIANGTPGAGFVISPAGDSAIGELTLSAITFAGGAQYRVTTSGDTTSDRLLIDGDLSALTIVPATNTEITGSSYVIATGATTGKPALSGFPSKFRLIRQGNDLLLTSASGTLIILR